MNAPDKLAQFIRLTREPLPASTKRYLPGSRADIQVTNRIAEAGRLLGIVVHDHVIIGREGHVSLKAKGLI